MSTMLALHRSPSPPSSLRVLALAGVVALGCLSAGCNDDKKAAGLGGAGGGGGAGMAATASGMAILNSDYQTTSVSLYAPASGQLVDACVTSGVTSATLTQPLSDDVMLPTQAQVGGKLVLLDNAASVLTFVDPASCAVTAQLSVTTGGFNSFPHDIVTLSSTKAYVTRYQTNAMPTADPADFDEGDDLLIVDPALLTVTGRFALTAYATPGPGGAPTQARPDRALLAGGLVYVTLNSIDANFTATGAGRVAIVDPTADMVTGVIDLPNQKDCSGMTYVAATKKLYVACGGAFTDAAQAAESALVEIDLSGAAPVVGRSFQAAALGTGTESLNFFYAAVSGDTAFVGTLGLFADEKSGFAGTPDAFYAVSLTTGVPVKLATGEAGTLGSAVVNEAAKRLFLPDASATAPLVHIFDVSGAVPVALPGFEPNPSTHLPPRSIAGL